MIRAYVLAIALVAGFAAKAQATERRAPLPYAKASSRFQNAKAIELSGHLSVLGEIATLDGPTAGKPMLVDLSTLSREDRSTIRTRCTLSCDVRITGVSGSVMRETGMIATAFALADQDASSKLASSK